MNELPAGLASRFRVLSALGEGAFGRVLEVRDRASGLALALKLQPLPPDSRRVIRELELLRRLRHPHLIACLGAGAEEGVAWIAMERAEGDLREVMTPSRCEEGWELLRQAARGVAALHRAGLVHRDLKPANVLLVGGEARVADLGLVRGAELATLTAEGMVLGTPAYMAPEQARGQRATAASDAWALGMMFHQLLEGRLPWPDEDPVALLARVARAGPPRLARARDRLPTEVAERLEAMLDPDPGRRPGDLEALADTLGPLPEAAPGRLAAEAPVETVRLEAAPAEVRRGADTLGPSPVAPAGSEGASRPGRGRLRGALLALAGILGLLWLGGFLLSASTATSRRVRPPAELAAALELRELQPRVRHELGQAAVCWWDPETRVVRQAEGSRPEGWLDLVNRDPAHFPVLVEALPNLRESWGLLARSPDLPRGDEELARELRQSDEWFAAQDLPRPFAPYLTARPRELSGPEREALRREVRFELFDLVLPAKLGPWTQATLRHLVALEERVERRRQEALAFLRGDAPGALPPSMGRLYRFLEGSKRELDPGRTPVSIPGNYEVDARIRRELAGWVGGGDELRRFLLTCHRAHGEEPETARTLACLVLLRVHGLRSLFYPASGHLHPDLWLPPPDVPPQDTLRILVLAMRYRLDGVRRREGEGARRELLDRLADLLGRPVLRRTPRGRRLRFLAFRKVLEAFRNREEWEVTQQVLLRHFDEMSATDPEDLLHLSRRLLEELDRFPDRLRLRLGAERLEHLRGQRERCLERSLHEGQEGVEELGPVLARLLERARGG